MHVADRDGVALVLALVALVVVGGLVAVAFLVGRQAQAIGRSSVRLGQAFAAADGGAQAIVAGWLPGYASLPPGSAATVNQTWLADSSGWYRGSVTRVAGALFLVSAEGFSRDSASRQQVGAWVELAPLAERIAAPLITEDSPELPGITASINAADQPPAGWGNCGPIAASLPRVRVVGPNSGWGRGDTTAPNGAEFRPGSTLPAETVAALGLSYEDLVLRATKTLPAGSYGGIGPESGLGICDTMSMGNWGDPAHPARPCGTYFPVVHVIGDATVNGDQGQGVLLVDGSLTISGSFNFAGVMVVRGALRVTGAGATVEGFVIASRVAGLPAVRGGDTYSYSKCAIRRALESLGTGKLLPERSWISLN